MNIGLIDVDKTRFMNLALGKIAAYHRSLGDSVEWADPMFGSYDRVYASKVFVFTPDFTDYYDCEVVKGGTGYDIHSVLPDEIDRLQPDYSIYPEIDSKTAYGFLTRGCPNKCKWCIVPLKEGNVHPYMDIDEITIGGTRTNVTLMDNNVLASDYGIATFGSDAGSYNKMFVLADLMPHHIRITDVKVERLQDISDEDCIKEGIVKRYDCGGIPYYKLNPNDGTVIYRTPQEAYAALIDKISGKGTWESNPYVFVYDFELVK